jgi:ribonuclease P protein component
MQKRYRLRKTWQFRLVRGEGRSWVHPLLVLYARPNEAGDSRVGFSVSKRIGKSVVRNQVRRRLRESVRLLWPKIEPGWDMVLIARSAIRGKSYHDISGAVEHVLCRAALLHDTTRDSERRVVPGEN